MLYELSGMIGAIFRIAGYLITAGRMAEFVQKQRSNCGERPSVDEPLAGLQRGRGKLLVFVLVNDPPFWSKPPSYIQV